MGFRAGLPPLDVAALRRMRESGMSWRECAAATGSSVGRLQYALSDKYRADTAARVRRRRDGVEPERHRGLVRRRSRKEDKVEKANGPIVGERDPARDAAIRAFAVGEIDRAALMRQLGKPS